MCFSAYAYKPYDSTNFAATQSIVLAGFHTLPHDLTLHVAPAPKDGTRSTPIAAGPPSESPTPPHPTHSPFSALLSCPTQVRAVGFNRSSDLNAFGKMFVCGGVRFVCRFVCVRVQVRVPVGVPVGVRWCAGSCVRVQVRVQVRVPFVCRLVCRSCAGWCADYF